MHELIVLHKSHSFQNDTRSQTSHEVDSRLMVMGSKKKAVTASSGRETLEGSMLLHNRGFVYWRTCLREIIITSDIKMLPIKIDGYEIYKDESAYQFLLEVICGLKSPVLGETEILGQFKNLISTNPSPYADFNKLTQSLLADAKIVRSRYLVNLGSQSYGSFVRKALPKDINVLFLGAGQLAQEIALWTTKISRRTIFFAPSDKNKNLVLNKFPQAEFYRLDENQFMVDGAYALVIAAPMSSVDILKLTRQFDNAPKVVIDLREDSHVDAVRAGFFEYNLQDIFSEIDKNRKMVDTKVDHAHKLIQELSQTRFEALYHRPFGWDDLC